MTHAGTTTSAVVAAPRQSAANALPGKRRRSAETPLRRTHGALNFGFAWLPPLLFVTAVLVLVPKEPAWLFMWGIAGAMWAGCKWAIFLGNGGFKAFKANRGGLLAWALWPGMNPRPFLASNLEGRARHSVRAVGRLAEVGAHKVPRPALREWIFGGAKTVVGSALLWLLSVRFLETNPLLAAWLGGIGVILMLHFGSFHLLALALSAAGFPVRPLMVNPVASVSLAEFWGRRWNTAFEELAHRYVFAPLARRHGLTAATLASFTVSGLIHDLVISVPARGGYGLPTAYFLVQGAGLLMERSRWGARMGLKRGVRGRLFTLFVIISPVFWLFHPTFMREVMLPFLRVLTAH